MVNVDGKTVCSVVIAARRIGCLMNVAMAPPSVGTLHHQRNQTVRPTIWLVAWRSGSGRQLKYIPVKFGLPIPQKSGFAAKCKLLQFCDVLVRCLLSVCTHNLVIVCLPRFQNRFTSLMMRAA